MTAGTGSHQRRLALGTLAQQGAQITAMLTMLVVATALARRLSLAEFGVYGLTLSFSTYLLFAQGSVEATAIKRLAEAGDEVDRNRAFTTAFAVYAAYGLTAGVLIAVAGIGLIGLFDIAPELREQARLGVLAIALLTIVGWPAKTFQDVLRGMQRFELAAAAEVVAYLMVMTTVLVLLFAFDPPLWALVGAVASLAPLMGLCSAVIVLVLGLPFRVRPSLLQREYTVAFLRFSLYLLASGVTDLVIYSVDRAVLAFYRPASTLGLYEAAVRPNSVVRGLQGSMVATVLPASARFMAEGDEMRVRELLLRGSRYVLGLTVPVIVTFIVLAQPILVVWVGDRFSDAATALAIFVSYWLLGGTTGVAASMLTAAGKVKALAVYSWGVGVVNLGLSLVLTPKLGLDGVVISTTAAYVAMAPLLFWLTFTTLPVTVGEFARRVWIPAYSGGAVLAAALLVLREHADLESLPALLAAAGVGCLVYWGTFYGLWMDADERRFLRSLVRREAPEDVPDPGLEGFQ